MTTEAPFTVGQAATLRNLAKWRNDPTLAPYIGKPGTVTSVRRGSRRGATWAVTVRFPWPEAPCGPDGVRVAWATANQVVALGQGKPADNG